MNIKIKMRGPDSEELQKQLSEELQKELQEFFNGAETDQEFNKRMNELENLYTPKREILQKSKKKFSSILDSYIQGTLTNEKALLLLQSKYQQLGEEIKDMAIKGCFIEIDYEDGKGYIPEEFMKIAGEVNYYYNITKNNIGGNTDIKLESFSSPATKRFVKSVSATFDKFFGTEEKKESQPEQRTTTLSQSSESPVAESDTAINLPLNNVLEKLADQNNPVLRRWTGGKYKCKNMRQFINEYADIARENPTKYLILDYLVRENGNPFKESSIISNLNSFGVAPERKKTKGRQRKNTHKKDFL